MQQPPRRLLMIHRLLIALVVIAAFGLRLPTPGEPPPGLYHDEGYNGIDAVGVLDGHVRLFFPANNGREPLFIYLTSAMVAILGRSPAAPRLAAALLGTASVAAVYAVGRVLFGRRVGLIGAALVAVAPWPVILGRVGFRAGSLILILSLAVAATELGRTRWRLTSSGNGQQASTGARWRWLALGGALAGLTLYTYTAAWAVPVLFGLWGSWLWLRGGTVDTRGAATWAAAAILVALPVPIGILMGKGGAIERLGQVALWNAPGGDGGVWSALGRNLERTAGMFAFVGDFIPRHNIPDRPMMAPVAALLWAVGLVIMVVWATRAVRAGVSSREDAAQFERQTGTRGRAGQTGTRGHAGQTGTRGHAGQTGTRGRAGQTGTRGHGQTSTKGHAGQTGTRGHAGQAGTRGHDGQTGAGGTPQDIHLQQRVGDRAVLVVLWLAVLSLPTLLAEHAPHFLRAAGALPAAAVVFGLGASSVFAVLVKRGRTLAVVGWVVVPAALAMELAATLQYRDAAAAGPVADQLYFAFETGATELAVDVNQALRAGWRGGWSARVAADADTTNAATDGAGPDGWTAISGGAGSEAWSATSGDAGSEAWRAPSGGAGPDKWSAPSAGAVPDAWIAARSGSDSDAWSTSSSRTTAAAPNHGGTGRAVWLDRRLRDGWASVPYLVPTDALTLTDPYDPLFTSGPGAAFVWPHEIDQEGAWSNHAPGLTFSRWRGSTERGDLEVDARLLYVRIDAAPSTVVDAPLARFANGTVLVDAKVTTPDGPAGPVIVDSLWEATERIDRDVTAFFQVLDGTSTVVVGNDAPLGAGWFQVPFWRVGDRIVERRTIEVPGGFDPTRYTLVTGVYEWPSTDAIPVLGPDGSADGGLVVLTP